MQNNEAALIVSDSPKASAALSRRCLQHVLRAAAGVKHQELYYEIEEVIEGSKLPPHLTDGLHAVRTIGNLAAHTTKSKVTGEIVPVGEGEAEWNLDVLEQLFEHYFVGPAIMKERKKTLNAKLKAADKSELK